LIVKVQMYRIWIACKPKWHLFVSEGFVITLKKQ
jgi:hypothetical protein